MAKLIKLADSCKHIAGAHVCQDHAVKSKGTFDWLRERKNERNRLASVASTKPGHVCRAYPTQLKTNSKRLPRSRLVPICTRMVVGWRFKQQLARSPVVIIWRE